MVNVVAWKSSSGAPFFTFPFRAAFIFLTTIQIVLIFSALRLPVRIEYGRDVKQDAGQEVIEAVSD